MLLCFYVYVRVCMCLAALHVRLQVAGEVEVGSRCVRGVVEEGSMGDRGRAKVASRCGRGGVKEESRCSRCGRGGVEVG